MMPAGHRRRDQGRAADSGRTAAPSGRCRVTTARPRRERRRRRSRSPQSAPITEAWASSPGCSEPVRRDTLESPVTVIARFCQPHPESSHHLAVTGGPRPCRLKCIAKLCNHGRACPGPSEADLLSGGRPDQPTGHAARPATDCRCAGATAVHDRGPGRHPDIRPGRSGPLLAADDDHPGSQARRRRAGVTHRRPRRCAGRADPYHAPRESRP